MLPKTIDLVIRIIIWYKLQFICLWRQHKVIVKNTGSWATPPRFSGPKSSTQKLESKPMFLLGACQQHGPLIVCGPSYKVWVSYLGSALAQLTQWAYSWSYRSQLYISTVSYFLTQCSVINWSIPGESNFFGAERITTAMIYLRRQNKNKEEECKKNPKQK